MNKEQLDGLVGAEVAYTLTTRGRRPPRKPLSTQVYRGTVRSVRETWWHLGKQRANGVGIQRADRGRLDVLDHVEPVAVISTWDEWEQRLQSRDRRDEQDLRGERLALLLGGTYMRNANGGVVLLDLDRAEAAWKHITS